jgi:hypothetical protein
MAVSPFWPTAPMLAQSQDACTVMGRRPLPRGELSLGMQAALQAYGKSMLVTSRCKLLCSFNYYLFSSLLEIAMDFLYYNLKFQVLICTCYQYALVPSTIAAYLRSVHKEEVTEAEAKSCVEFWKN